MLRMLWLCHPLLCLLVAFSLPLLPPSLTFMSVSLSVVCSHAVVLNLCLCLFPLASFPTPCKHMHPRDRGSQRGSGVIQHRCRWLFTSGSLSLPLAVYLHQPVFSIKLKQGYWHGTFLTFLHWHSFSAPFLFPFVTHSYNYTFLAQTMNFTRGENSWRLLHLFFFFPPTVSSSHKQFLIQSLIYIVIRQDCMMGGHQVLPNNSQSLSFQS